MALSKAPVPIPAYEQADAYALQAIWEGRATPDQQKRGLKWIIESACDTYGFPDKPDKEDLKNIWLGRMFAGKQIVKLIKINATLLKKPTEEN